jgi:hypothetical protein
MRKRQLTIVGAAALLTVGLGASAALANADHKTDRTHDYTSTAHASAGVPTPLAVPVTYGQTSAGSTTDQSAGRSTASADAAGTTVAGTTVVDGSQCAAAGDDQGGEASDSQQHSLTTTIAGPVTVTVLPNSCTARAVQDNTGASSADSALVTVDIDPGTGSPVTSVSLLRSHSEEETTSGQARSESSLDPVVIDGADPLPAPATCQASSQASNGEPSGPAASACDGAATASTSYSK